jgi:hypothetical protein
MPIDILWKDICEGLETLPESPVLFRPALTPAEKLIWPGASDSAAFFFPLASQFNRML